MHEEISKWHLLIEYEGNYPCLREALDSLDIDSGHEVGVVCQWVDDTVVGGDVGNFGDGREPGREVRDICV